MSDTELEADVTVDAIRSSCPGPLMDLIGKVKNAAPGTVIRLQSSNADTETDLREWADQSGNDVLDVVAHDDYWDLYVRVND